MTRSVPFQSPAIGRTAGPPSIGTEPDGRRVEQVRHRQNERRSVACRGAGSSRPSPFQSPATGKTVGPAGRNQRVHGRALVVEAGDGPVALLVHADAVVAVAVPVADHGKGVGAALRWS